jgi:predicted transglutaminase-like cysteine proteinase
MPRNLALKRGSLVLALIAGIIRYFLGDWQAIALGFADLSPSQKVALRFPDLSPSQNVALRFPDLSSSQNVTPRFPELSPSQIIALRFPKASTPAAALALPAQPLRLIDFQVTATLPPIGHSRFCLRYPEDCKVHANDFRHRNIVLTPERLNELNSINRDVNRGIVPVVTSGDGLTEEWVISPATGDCKAYAVTKRHELLARNWPSRALLLSEVELSSGEHHLVLVVRVRDADLVLDNLNDKVRLVAMTYDRYHWVRVQSPQNPKFWMQVRSRDDVRTAMLAN